MNNTTIQAIIKEFNNRINELESKIEYLETQNQLLLSQINMGSIYANRS